MTFPGPLRTIRTTFFLALTAVLLAACSTSGPKPSGATSPEERVTCYSCRGTGRCSFCATGQGECSSCNSTGRITSGDQDRSCSACDGTGRRPCIQCRGSTRCGSCRGLGYRDAEPSPLDPP